MPLLGTECSGPDSVSIAFCMLMQRRGTSAARSTRGFLRSVGDMSTEDTED
jgi:hypothetical protein